MSSRRDALRGAGLVTAGLALPGLSLRAFAQGRHQVITLASTDVRVIARGVRAPEGPTELPDGSVAMVEFMAGNVLRVAQDGTKGVLASPGSGTAGTVLGRDGALYVAKLNTEVFMRRAVGAAPPQAPPSGGAPPPSTDPAEVRPPATPSAIVRIDLATRAATTVYREYEGKELPGPNDLVVDGWGDLWFSDPSAGAVFNARTDGSGIHRVIEDVPGVNGITLSPDRRRLYIFSRKALVAFDIADRGALVQQGGRPRLTRIAPWPEGIHEPDGFKTEAGGNILCACREDGVLAFSPQGELLSQTIVPGMRVVNIAFGGAQQRTLYLAANEPDSMLGLLASISWPRAGMANAMAASAAAGPQIAVLASGLQFPEAPLVFSDGRVTAVEILANKITQVSAEGAVSTLIDIGPGPNGQAIGPDGALYVLTNGGRPGNKVGGSVQRVDLATRNARTLHTEYEGQRLQGPNDLVFDEWGDFWFTDFAGGTLYNARTDGSALRRIAMITGANGIGLAPDGRTLYIAQAHERRVVSLRITARAAVAQSQGAADVTLLAQLEDSLDSLKVEASGNVVVASSEAGLTTIAADGRVLGKTPVGGLRITNLAFGGADLRTVYATGNLPGGTTGQLVSLRWPRPGLKLRYT